MADKRKAKITGKFGDYRLRKSPITQSREIAFIGNDGGQLQLQVDQLSAFICELIHSANNLTKEEEEHE